MHLRECSFTSSALTTQSPSLLTPLTRIRSVLAPGTCNPTPPWPCNGDSVRHHKTPLTPDQAIVADIIERKKASLPPKPAAAVLAAAAARKTTRKHVFFSTPTSSIRRSPVLPNDHVTAHPGTGGNMAKYVTPEQHITPPPPPYTPVNAVTHASYSVTSGRPAFEYACTPACDTTRYVPPAPAHLTAGQSTINNVTTIFPSVIAASEALRINLGLECGQTGLLFGGPLHQTGTFGMPLQRSPSIPGVTIPQFQFGVEPAVTRGTGNEATAHTNHYKIFAGLEPLPGMTQPLACLSPNLPPVSVELSPFFL